MKRSEALSKLTEFLQQQRLTRISANSEEGRLSLDILDFLERELRMAPPYSSKAFSQASIHFGSNAHGFEWDAEDDV